MCATAAIIGGALGAGGSIASGLLGGGSSGSSGLNKTAHAQLEINRQNLEQQAKLMGAGAPTFLNWAPGNYEYETGVLFPRAKQLAEESWKSLGGNAADVIKRYQTLVNAYSPQFSKTWNDIFGGGYERQQLEAQKPVEAARLATADAARAAAATAAQQAQGQTAAQYARGGFTGGGSARANQLVNQGLFPIYNQAAQQQAAAALANEAERANITNQWITSRAKLGLETPQYIQQLGALESMPTDLATRAYISSLGAFAPFQRPQNVPWAQLTAPNYTQPSTASPWAYALSGLGQLGSSMGNYYANQELINSLQNMNLAGAQGGSYNPGLWYYPTNVPSAASSMMNFTPASTYAVTPPATGMLF